MIANAGSASRAFTTKAIGQLKPALGVLLLSVLALSCTQQQQHGVQLPDQPTAYIGGATCASCHPAQAASWKGSHHDLAMQEASVQAVLGDFSGTEFSYAGVTSTFFKRDGKFMVRTDGPDGRLQDYEIAYAFGVEPLQQYLIEFPGGRYQALSICWDSRPAAQGGQRWFHLYPDEGITHDDELHWTGPNQNWNYMCAECHSTNLEKNYQLQGNRFETTWSEIDVSCEACHGPGSRHAAWAEKKAGRAEGQGASMGLAVQLGEEDAVRWIFDPQTGNARRQPPPRSRAEIETCARCHSRRAALSSQYVHGKPLMDTHRPSLLEESLYFADGQIRDEVYVYGSFLQSKMYSQGVTCNDCHDPHNLRVYSAGNSLCARCHLPAKFDSSAHHFHPQGSPGASCVECHMPARNYMVVDPRRDHSFRVPRPDLSVKLGTPNACNGCHTDQTPRWAADEVARRSEARPNVLPHYGEALQAGRQGRPGAGQSLLELIVQTPNPAIVRATALSLLPGNASREATAVIQSSLGDPDPLVRLAALQAAQMLPPQVRLQPAAPLLKDPVRTVRLEAASLLASLPAQMLSTDQQKARQAAVEEYLQAQMSNAERPESHLNRGALYQQLGQFAQAEAAYQTALKIDSRFAPAYVNLSDLYRQQDREPEGEEVLRIGLGSLDDASLHHALGLVLVRQKRHSEALGELEKAARQRPEEPRYGYVYAVALHSEGQGERAIAALENALQRHPYNQELLLGLISFHREGGSLPEAIRYARRLVEASDRSPQAVQLLHQLEAQ